MVNTLNNFYHKKNSLSDFLEILTKLSKILFFSVKYFLTKKHPENAKIGQNTQLGMEYRKKEEIKKFSVKSLFNSS